MSNVISAKVSEDLKDRIEGYTERGETRSEAVRRYLRAGIDAKHGTQSIPTPFFVAWVASIFAAGAFLETSQTVGSVSLVVAVIALALPHERLRPLRSAGMKRYTAIRRFVGRVVGDRDD